MRMRSRSLIICIHFGVLGYVVSSVCPKIFTQLLNERELTIVHNVFAMTSS